MTKTKIVRYSVSADVEVTVPASGKASMDGITEQRSAAMAAANEALDIDFPVDDVEMKITQIVAHDHETKEVTYMVNARITKANRA